MPAPGSSQVPTHIAAASPRVMSMLRVVPNFLTRSALNRVLLIASVVTGLLLIRIFWISPPSYDAGPGVRGGFHPTSVSQASRPTHAADNLGKPSIVSTSLPCAQFPGAEDILVVMKTGATEALNKVPTHFRTTFRCMPHYVIYSDFEEEIAGHHIYDSLDEVDDEIKRTNPDFDIYRRLQKDGRAGLRPEELEEGTGGTGWHLDKWKFLPLVDKALKDRPDAKWFVFIEADTSLIWSNLLKWLTHFDPAKPHYIGGQMQIGPVIFSYGGSGTILSNPAMRMVSERRAKELAAYDNYTAQHWAGDCVLGKILEDVKVPLLWSWPIIQGETPSTLDHNTVGYSKRLWCFPVVSYHHMSSDEVTSMWNFEQDWINRNPSLLRHKDVFQRYVLPKIVPELKDWDNLSDDLKYSNQNLESLSQKEKDALSSFEACRDLCESQDDCMQYLYSPNQCTTSKVIKIGHGNSTFPGGIQSGWMTKRIEAFARDAEPCGNEGWIL